MEEQELMISKKSIRIDSHLGKLISFVVRKGSVYLDDLMLYGLSLENNRNNVYRLRNELLDRGYINIKTIEIKKSKRAKEYIKVVEPTTYGLAEVLLNFPPETKDYFINLNEKFKTKSTDKLKGMLDQNHIKSFFNVCGIQTEPMSRRPSVEQLYNFINGTGNNKNSLPQDYVKETLRTGLYFSASEIRAGAKALINLDEPISSVFNGLIITESEFIVVYSQKIDKDKLIYIKYQNNEILLHDNVLRKMFKAKRISAMALGNLNSFIYATAEERKRGRHNDNSKMRLPILSPVSELVQNHYNNLYCLTLSSTEIDTMKCIVRGTNVNGIDQICKADKKFALNKEDKIMPLHYNLNGTNHPCAVVMAYELKALHQIKLSRHTPVIITTKDKIDNIQHITHKEHLFIDYNTLKPIKNSNALIYDSKGNPKGTQMLKDYLHSIGQSINQSEYKNIPKQYDMAFTDFYNAIAKGNIKVEQVAKELKGKTKEYDEKRHYTIRKKSIDIPVELHTKLKDYANSHGRTLQWAIRTCLKYEEPSDQD